MQIATVGLDLAKNVFQMNSRPKKTHSRNGVAAKRHGNRKRPDHCLPAIDS